MNDPKSKQGSDTKKPMLRRLARLKVFATGTGDLSEKNSEFYLFGLAFLFFQGIMITISPSFQVWIEVFRKFVIILKRAVWFTNLLKLG